MAESGKSDLSRHPGPSFAVRRPVVTTVALYLMIEGPAALVELAIGMPWELVLGIAVAMAGLFAFLMNRLLKHPDDPGPVALAMLRFNDFAARGWAGPYFDDDGRSAGSGDSSADEITRD